jgi:hypothetical protein
MKTILIIVMAVFVLAGCARNPDGDHTTATTVVPPPPRQVLRAEFRRTEPITFKGETAYLDGHGFDRLKPILFFVKPQKEETYREGQPVVIQFILVNAQLKGDGGEYRVRYMVDDDDMQWIDSIGEVSLWGWLPGKHTIRLELVGPDGWPYRNGDLNVETREITIVK